MSCERCYHRARPRGHGDQCECLVDLREDTLTSPRYRLWRVSGGVVVSCIQRPGSAVVALMSDPVFAPRYPGEHPRRSNGYPVWRYGSWDEAIGQAAQLVHELQTIDYRRGNFFSAREGANV